MHNYAYSPIIASRGAAYMSVEREWISTACFAHKIDDEDIANRHMQYSQLKEGDKI